MHKEEEDAVFSLCAVKLLNAKENGQSSPDISDPTAFVQFNLDRANTALSICPPQPHAMLKTCNISIHYTRFL